MPRLWHSILTASLVLFPASAFADEAKELKIIATVKEKDTQRILGPIVLNKANPFVIRSAEELVAASNKKKSAKEADVQKEMETAVAKLFKVDAIDWKKHMIVVAVAESIDAIKADGKTITITFTRYIERPTRAVLPWPKILMLVERSDGEVKLDPKDPKEEKKK